MGKPESVIVIHGTYYTISVPVAEKAEKDYGINGSCPNQPTSPPPLV